MVYRTCGYKIIWPEHNIISSSSSYEIYFLPMLRYMHHGREHHMLQLRWIIWGINIDLTNIFHKFRQNDNE